MYYKRFGNPGPFLWDKPKPDIAEPEPAPAVHSLITGCQHPDRIYKS